MNAEQVSDERGKQDSEAVIAYAARPLNPDRLAAVLRHASGKVLDVGCGNGAYVLHLCDRLDIHGVDYKPFDSWKEQPDRFRISDAASLELPNASVDTVLSFETLEHLPDPKKALQEYFRVARRNLILTVPNCRLPEGFKQTGLIFSHWNDPTHVQFFDPQSLARLVEQAGFRIVHQTLINQVNLGIVVMDGLGLSGRLARIGARVFRLLQRRRYFLTTLLVAEKPGNPIEPIAR